MDVIYIRIGLVILLMGIIFFNLLMFSYLGKWGTGGLLALIYVDFITISIFLGIISHNNKLCGIPLIVMGVFAFVILGLTISGSDRYRIIELIFGGFFMIFIGYIVIKNDQLFKKEGEDK